MTIMELGRTNKKIFRLDHRHVMRDPRTWKSSSDPYYSYLHCLKPEIVDWFLDNGFAYKFGGYHGEYTLYVDDTNQALMFKLTWM